MASSSGGDTAKRYPLHRLHSRGGPVPATEIPHSSSILSINSSPSSHSISHSPISVICSGSTIHSRRSASSVATLSSNFRGAIRHITRACLARSCARHSARPSARPSSNHCTVHCCTLSYKMILSSFKRPASVTPSPAALRRGENAAFHMEQALATAPVSTAFESTRSGASAFAGPRGSTHRVSGMPAG